MNDLKKQSNNGRDNLLNPSGKLCSNCYWGGFVTKDDEFVTCGIYVKNFSKNSFCEQWKVNTPEAIIERGLKNGY